MFHRGRSVLGAICVLFLACSAIAVTEGSADAQTKSAVHVRKYDNKLTPREVGIVEATVHAGAWCKVTFNHKRSGKLPARRISSVPKKISTGVVQFSWTTARTAERGTWSFQIGCASSKARAKAGKFNAKHSGKVTVAGTKKSARDTIASKLKTTVLGASDVIETGLGSAITSCQPYGTLILSGSDWLGGHGVNVYSNGSTGSKCLSYTNSYQCVELVNRLITTLGWSPRIGGNATNIYDNASTAYFDKHPNNSGYLPVPGDIVVWGGGGGKNYGHVAIVNADSNGVLTVVQQNASVDGFGTIRISNNGGAASWGSLYVKGFLHAKANTIGSGAPSSASPTAPPANPTRGTTATPGTTGSGTVQASPCLNLRSGPNGASGVLACIPKDSTIAIDCTAQGDAVSGPWGTLTTWDHTSYGGQTGYVSDAWIYTGTNNAVAGPCGGTSGGGASGTPAPSSPSPAATGQISISPCLDFHSAPGGSAPVVGCIPDGTVIGIYCVTQSNAVTGPWGRTTIWDQTVFNGVTGYVTDAYVYTGTNNAVAPSC